MELHMELHSQPTAGGASQGRSRHERQEDQSDDNRQRVLLERASVLIEADGGFLEIARQGENHKYLGRVLTGNPRQRGRGNLLHRISVAWMKFNIHRQTLLNKKIPVDLRLKLFNAIVPPAALYSLSSTPLTTACLEKLDATQRKMLRSIVGWPREFSGTWEERGRLMKSKMEAVLVKHPVEDWSALLHERKAALEAKTHEDRTSSVTMAAYMWKPESTRNIIANSVQGARRKCRPPMRWHTCVDDGV